MLEILCSDGNDGIRLERLEDGRPRIHVGTQHGIEAILAEVGAELSEDEASACRRLWSDDTSPRVHQQLPEGTLFTLPMQ